MIQKRLGANLEACRSNAAAKQWTDPRVLALLPELHLGYGRWLPGTPANYLNWRTGLFSASGAPAEGIVKGQPAQAPMPYSAWLNITAKAGCPPLIQVNLCTEPTGAFVVDSAGVTRQVGDALAMLDAIASTQPSLMVEPLIECGNEMYRRGDPATVGYASNPSLYVNAVEELVSAARAKYKGARFGACSLLDIYHGINPQWRSTIEGQLAGVVDAFTYHHYLPIPEAPTATNADALVADALADYEHAYRSTFDTIPAGHTAWATEWNYLDTSPFAAQMAASPTHGLVMAALALRFLSEPVVELTGPHATVGSAGSVYAAIASSANGPPALTNYGNALAGVGWLLNPSGPPPVAFGYGAAMVAAAANPNLEGAAPRP